MDIKKRVLVADDDTNILDLLRTGLEISGYMVDCADNAKKTMELIKFSRPDVILMDVSMPGEDGISFCRNLKNSEDTASIPVLILTAFSDGNTFNDAMLFGASGFIAKPFELSEVTKKIENCIAKANTKKEHKK